MAEIFLIIPPSFHQRYAVRQPPGLNITAKPVRLCPLTLSTLRRESRRRSKIRHDLTQSVGFFCESIAYRDIRIIL